ncbi:unnamed protein product [Linum tenue]|uniref:Fatty acid hydroxylase domain-containing protein n=1 Tax=Linum tenue TaxID=586396 RepID=A0AAV0IGK8_9ROSI|nr:unnamed protein product [Linum tenue]
MMGWILDRIVLPSNFVSKYRLHTKEEEEKKNVVPMSTVAKGVLFHQFLQITAAHLWFSTRSCIRDRNDPTFDSNPDPPGRRGNVRNGHVAVLRSSLHARKQVLLPRHVHSLHHKLVVPYAIGALYHHWVQALLLDTGGGVLAFMVSGMTPRTGMIFFCFVTVKAVDDHCGVWFPRANVFHLLFANNSAYHDVHHQPGGGKYNFSQPFFPIWDKLLGTHMPFVVLKRFGGGYEARMTMKDGWHCCLG